MRRSKNAKIVGIIIILILVVLVGVVSFFGFKLVKTKLGITANNSETNKSENVFESSEAEDNWQRNNNSEVAKNENKSEEENKTVTSLDEIANNINTTNTTSTTTTSTNNIETSNVGKKVMYKGYEKIGTIKIPKTNIEYPILAECTKTTIEMAVAKMYGPNPNEVGILTLVSHNYKNATLFSNNKKLVAGDVIYITDMNNNKVKYTIYDKFETTPEDTSFMKKDSEGKRIVALSTCTDDSKSRLILMAKED